VAACADEDRHGAEPQQRAHGPDREPVGGAIALPRLPARAPDQRDGGDQDQHREPVVAHHEAGREVVSHREAAEHGLPQHPERKQQSEQSEIAPVGAAAEGEQAGGGGREPDEPESRRLPNSITAWVSSGGATLP
jgi:hypothetical protein